MTIKRASISVYRIRKWIKAEKIRMGTIFIILAMATVLAWATERKRTFIPDRVHGRALTRGEIRYAAEKMLLERSRFKNGIRFAGMEPNYLPDKTIKSYDVCFLIRDKIQPEDFFPIIKNKAAFLQRCAMDDSPEAFYQTLVASRLTAYRLDIFEKYFYTQTMAAHRDDGCFAGAHPGLPGSFVAHDNAVRQVHQINPDAVVVSIYNFSGFYELKTKDDETYCYITVSRHPRFGYGLHKTENGCEVDSYASLESILSPKKWKKFVDQSRTDWDRYLSGYKREHRELENGRLKESSGGI